MIKFIIDALGGYVDPLLGWFMDGGFVMILTATMTGIITRNKKQRWKIEGKEEDIETLAIAILNMKGVVMGMFDIFVLVFSTSKGITDEVKVDMFNKVDQIKRDFGARIDQQILDAMAIAKVTNKKTLAEAKEGIAEIKSETMSVIDQLAAKANEIVSKELNKN